VSLFIPSITILYKAYHIHTKQCQLQRIYQSKHSSQAHQSFKSQAATSQITTVVSSIYEARTLARQVKCTPHMPSSCAVLTRRPQKLPSRIDKHTESSYVGRPFPLEEADEHWARLKSWGLTFCKSTLLCLLEDFLCWSIDQ
jgi:hypothetical protein